MLVFLHNILYVKNVCVEFDEQANSQIDNNYNVFISSHLFMHTSQYINACGYHVLLHEIYSEIFHTKQQSIGYPLCMSPHDVTMKFTKNMLIQQYKSYFEYLI